MSELHFIKYTEHRNGLPDMANRCFVLKELFAVKPWEMAVCCY